MAEAATRAARVEQAAGMVEAVKAAEPVAATAEVATAAVDGGGGKGALDGGKGGGGAGGGGEPVVGMVEVVREAGRRVRRR